MPHILPYFLLIVYPALILKGITIDPAILACLLKRRVNRPESYIPSLEGAYSFKRISLFPRAAAEDNDSDFPMASIINKFRIFRAFLLSKLLMSEHCCL
jgi:hypothetical protein